MLSTRTSLRCLFRVWFMGAAMTTHGMQHLGLLYALDPGLSQLHKDAQELSLARGRYLAHVNTHPFMAPILVGFLLSVEGLVAMHKMPAQHMSGLIHSTAETLSAIGDSFFSGTLMVFWALVATFFTIQGFAWLAIVWSVLLLACLLIFRISFFFLGLRQGLMALHKLSKFNLINKASGLKVINAVLIAIIYGSICSKSDQGLLWTNFFAGVLLICLGAFLIYAVHVPRVLLVGLGFLAYSVYFLNPSFF